MKAALLVAPGEFEIVERPVPEPAAGEVLIKVSRVGICGSDVHVYKGEYEREQLPRVLGHEFAGSIIHSNTASPMGFAVGDVVTADINLGCGKCRYCLTGNAVLCPSVRKIGIHVDGAFAEYITVPASQVIRLPHGMHPDVGALLEPAGCVARSLRRCSIEKGDTLLVIGGGPMGILHVQMAKAIGAGPIVVVEPDPKRAHLAASYGADAVAQDMDLLDDVALEIVGSGGFDVVVECVGKAELYAPALRALRARGRLCCFGVEQVGRMAGLEPFDIVLSEKTIIGSVGAMADDMRNAAEMLHGGKIDTSAYTKHVFPLAKIDLAMKAFSIDKVGLKVQVDPSAAK